MFINNNQHYSLAPIKHFLIDSGNLLVVVNSSANFFIYLIFSKEYRDQFVETILRFPSKQHHQSSPSIKNHAQSTKRRRVNGIAPPVNSVREMSSVSSQGEEHCLHIIQPITNGNNTLLKIEMYDHAIQYRTHPGSISHLFTILVSKQSSQFNRHGLFASETKFSK